MKIRIPLLALTVIFLLVLSLRATTVERLDLDDLVRKSSSIVVGRVNSSRTFWSANRKAILTSYSVEIRETLKGPASKSVEVTTIGGTLNGVTLHVPGMPVFRAGENTVVFLETAASFSTVVGLSQGKFAIENEEVRNTVAGLEFSDGRDGNPLRMKIQPFKNQIKAILASQP